MIRPKLLIASIVIVALGIAMALANSEDRAKKVAGELVEASSVEPQNEGKLVIISGTPELADGGVIVDEETGLQVSNAISYSRVPYQKVYKEESREVVVDRGEDKLRDFDDKTRTEYHVVEAWINADSSREPYVSGDGARHENPEPVNLPAYHKMGDLRLAGFKISAGDVSPYLHHSTGTFTPEELATTCGEYIAHSELDLKVVERKDGDGMLSTGSDIGDVQVLLSYQRLDSADPVTLIGRQQGDELVLVEDDVVSELEQVQAGAISREEFLDSITSEDSSSRMIGIGFIVVGAILLVFSLGFIQRP